MARGLSARSGWVVGQPTGFARGGGAHDYQAGRLGWISLPARAATLTRKLDRCDRAGRRPVEHATANEAETAALARLREGEELLVFDRYHRSHRRARPHAPSSSQRS